MAGPGLDRTAKAQDVWRIEDHVCRICFSRVLSRPDSDGGRVYRCSGCGSRAVGHSPSLVCACGLKTRNGHNLGIRCIVNDAPSPEAPVQVVARQVVT